MAVHFLGRFRAGSIDEEYPREVAVEVNDGPPEDEEDELLAEEADDDTEEFDAVEDTVAVDVEAELRLLLTLLLLLILEDAWAPPPDI